MKIVKAEESKGIRVPAPYERQIKVLMAPDCNGVKEATLSQVILPPGSQTDYHDHDRCEFIYIVSGNAVLEWEEKKFQLTADTAIYISPKEKHKLINVLDEPLKMITFFVPPFESKELYEICLNNAKNANL